MALTTLSVVLMFENSKRLWLLTLNRFLKRKEKSIKIYFISSDNQSIFRQSNVPA